MRIGLASRSACSAGHRERGGNVEKWNPESCAREAGYDEGYAAGRGESQSERDALRAEVEVMRRAVHLVAEMVDCNTFPLLDTCLLPPSECDHAKIGFWAISEARKAQP